MGLGPCQSRSSGGGLPSVRRPGYRVFSGPPGSARGGLEHILHSGKPPCNRSQDH